MKDDDEMHKRGKEEDQCFFDGSALICGCDEATLRVLCGS